LPQGKMWRYHIEWRPTNTLGKLFHYHGSTDPTIPSGVSFGLHKSISTLLFRAQQ
jgi:hypothetical protein